MRYDLTLLAATAEAMARPAVEVPREVQAVAAVGFGISNRLRPLLICDYYPSASSSTSSAPQQQQQQRQQQQQE